MKAEIITKKKKLYLYGTIIFGIFSMLILTIPDKYFLNDNNYQLCTTFSCDIEQNNQNYKNFNGLKTKIYILFFTIPLFLISFVSYITFYIIGRKK